MTTAPAQPAAARSEPSGVRAAEARPLPYPLRSLRLHLAEKANAFLAPMLILLAVVVVTVLIGLVIGIATGFPLPDAVGEGFRSNNLGMFWAVTGFFISSAALSMNRTFTTVLALGATRRDYWLGSTAGFAVTSLVFALYSLLLLLVEKATGGWFLGVHALDVTVLGDGDPLRTVVTVFLFALGSLLLGAAFGTVFRAYGARVLTAIILAAALVVIGLVALAVWQWDTTLQLVSGTGAWLPSLILLVLVLVGAGGSFVAIRRASV
ncbi:hypothetical protein [Brachybacterium epidermidis]|uniref:hypothetical protein n=1 Tax=Brachybacterium epidermidis TaxID=2781983 RepID=UPI00398E8FF6